MSESSSPARWPLYLILAAMIVVPYLFFRMTWFGRRLSDEELSAKLASDESRDVQHGLEEMSRRIEEDREQARPFHDEVVAVADHPEPAVRNMVAWVMGQDNESEPFHEALRGLVRDEALVVRQNAALSLTRFGDDAGRPILVGMLEAHRLDSPVSGTVEDVLPDGTSVRQETEVARVKDASGEVHKIRTPLDGRVQRVVAREGAPIDQGAEVASIAPNDQQVWEALKGLYLVGKPEDVPAIQRWEQGVSGYPDSIRVQARHTLEAIRARAGAAEPKE